MKSKLKLLPVLTLCASPVISHAATDSSEAGSDEANEATTTGCKNPSKDPDS